MLSNMGQREEVVKELLYSQFVVIHELKAGSNLHCDLSVPHCPAHHQLQCKGGNQWIVLAIPYLEVYREGERAKSSTECHQNLCKRQGWRAYCKKNTGCEVHECSCLIRKLYGYTNFTARSWVPVVSLFSVTHCRQSVLPRANSIIKTHH